MDHAEDAGNLGFHWEGAIKNNWNDLREDDGGNLILTEIPHTMSLKFLESSFSNVRKSVVRNMCILLDWSHSAYSSDILPYRGYWVVSNVLKPFIKELFEKNPLAHIEIILLKDSIGKILCGMTNEVDLLTSKCDELVARGEVPQGNLSILNGTQVAISSLLHSAIGESREIILLQISINTFDPHDSSDVIRLLHEKKIQFNAVSLFVEINLCKKLCSQSKGTHLVAQNEKNMLELCKTFIEPPSIFRDLKPNSRLIKIGFPSRRFTEERERCACHNLLAKEPYCCPRCKALVCRIPTQCPVCKLSLMTASHLSRSFYHLYRPKFMNLQSNDFGSKIDCEGCGTDCSVGTQKCLNCAGLFCTKCTLFITTTLNHCPKCLRSQNSSKS